MKRDEERPKAFSHMLAFGMMYGFYGSALYTGVIILLNSAPDFVVGLTMNVSNSALTLDTFISAIIGVVATAFMFLGIIIGLSIAVGIVPSIFVGVFVGMVVFVASRRLSSQHNIQMTRNAMYIIGGLITLVVAGYFYGTLFSVFANELTDFVLPASIVFLTPILIAVVAILRAIYLYFDELETYLRAQDPRKEKPKRKMKNNRLALEDEGSQSEVYEVTVREQEERKS